MPQFDVTVAGELNLDLILYGLPVELEPERELLATDLKLTLGASSAIVAHNLAALGCRVGFVSRIGDDAMGRTALERLTDAGVDVSQVHRSPNDSTGLTVILHHGSWRNILTYLGTISQLAPEDIDFQNLSSARHFHLSSFYLQTTLQPYVPELFKKLKAAGLTISFDTNDDPNDLWQGGLWEVLQHVDVLLPNEREAMKITGEPDLERAMARLAEVVPLVVVKLGSSGAMAQRGNQCIRSRAVKVNTVDTVGAGDSFDSGFIAHYIRGADIETCLAYGNLAGALSTTRPGGTEAFRDRKHLEQFFRDHHVIVAGSERT